MSTKLQAILALIATVLCGCATTERGNETAPLAAHIASAQGNVGRSRAEAKAIVSLVHGAGDLQKRIDFKTARALRLLDR